jgi:hypothetical protein
MRNDESESAATKTQRDERAPTIADALGRVSEVVLAVTTRC